jgi:hypothetical protein
MKTFTATIQTEYATYYIDLKTSRDFPSTNPYALMHPNGCVYLTSVSDCLDWIKHYDGLLKEQAEAEAVWQLQHA